MNARADAPRTAVVVAGAGARGGYEAGVLAVLIPRLRREARGAPVFVGTSAGALNAALFAAFAHLPPGEQAERVLGIWRETSVADVFRSPLVTAPGVLGRGVGQLLRVPGARLTGLVDTTPLRRLAERAVDWDRLHRNIDEGLVSLAVVTTSGRDNRTVVFVDEAGGDPVPPPDDDRPIDYVATRITPQHVLASSAIPVVFPPVLVDPATPGGGWHLDGGIRLNAPLKPALALGAERVVAVATHPFVDPPAPVGAPTVPPSGEAAPDVDDTVVRLIDAALVDRMVEDLRTLVKVNGLASARPAGEVDARVIPYLAVAPDDRGTVGALAAETLARHRRVRGGIAARLRGAELRLLGRVLLGDGSRRGELLSYLYFDRAFVDASIDLGRRDAQRALGVGAGRSLWRTAPLGTGESGPDGRPSVVRARSER